MLFNKKTRISEVIRERKIDYQNRRDALWELRDALKYVAFNGLRPPLDAPADEEDCEGMFLALFIAWWLNNWSLITDVGLETDAISEEGCGQEAGDVDNDEMNNDGALSHDPVLSQLTKDLARRLGFKDGEAEVDMTER